MKLLLVVLVWALMCGCRSADDCVKICGAHGVLKCPSSSGEEVICYPPPSPCVPTPCDGGVQ